MKKKKKYVIKFHGNDKDKEQINPFKKLENHVLKKVDYKFLYEKDDVTIENFIENKNFSYEEIKKKENILCMLHPIALMNKNMEIVSDLPNLYYIMKENKIAILKKISQNINKIGDEMLRNRIQGQFDKINDIFLFYQKTLKKEKLVLSHNDLIYKNFIYKKSNNQFILIDFEYSGYNPKGMDIFNTINEHLIDYNCEDSPKRQVLFENYPNDENIKEMIKFYLFFFNFGNELGDYQHKNQFIEKIRKDERFLNIKENEIMKIFERFSFFGVITNIYWYYWALYWFENKDIGFNYIRFSECKFDCIEYFTNKDGHSDLLK